MIEPDNSATSADQDDVAGGEDNLYRIGTVAQITDIAVERLRAWERRYGIVPAHRAGKTRFYSAEQLTRLKKIKRLIDGGQPIRTLADLTDEQLDERISEQRRMTTRAPKTGLIGPNLLVLEQQQEAAGSLEICARWANLSAYQAQQQGIEPPDVIVVQLPVLKSDQLDIIEELHPAARIVTVYQFATPAQVEALEQLGIPALRWPASWQEIEQAAVAGRDGVPGDAPPRRFSDEELIAIAASALGDRTGCPQHLVELVSQLNAFTDYAAACVADGADTALMGRIAFESAAARARMEQALEALAVAEGLIAAPG